QPGLPANPTNIWALPPTIYASLGSPAYLHQQLGLPAYPTNTIWALPPTIYASLGSPPTVHQQPGLPPPYHTIWALPADHIRISLWALPYFNQQPGPSRLPYHTIWALPRPYTHLWALPSTVQSATGPSATLPTPFGLSHCITSFGLSCLPLLLLSGLPTDPNIPLGSPS
ncbi:hypothetical protein DFJ58DRAFT_735410, partial [Suillus subalutaceus]|uniref:uncharacterized protein n=1 Tax=Suillus subalutaceus TaxID=48586 RepID=UPI001B8771EE